MGKPVQGAEIRFYRLIYEKGLIVSAEGKLEKTVTTDIHGGYSLSGLVSGQYKATVDLRGFRHTEIWGLYFPMGSDKVVDIGSEVGQITESRPIVVTGSVVRLDKTPLQDVTITIQSAFNREIVEQARTDKEGHYKIRLSVAGQYIVYASKPGFKVNATVIAGSTPEMEIVNFMLISMAPR